MPREIKTSLALDGEARFKQAMQSINREMRVLGSELGAVTSSYDKNNRSVEDLSRTNEILRRQEAQQRIAIEALEGAVRDSTSAFQAAQSRIADVTREFGENSREAQEAARAVNQAERAMDGYRTQLNNAQRSLNNIGRAISDNENEMRNLSEDTNRAAEELNDLRRAEAEETLNKIKTAAEKAAKAMEVIGKTAKAGFKVVSSAANVGIDGLKKYSAVAAGVGTAIVGITAKAASAADDINTLSTQTGLSTEEIQKFQYATDIIDVPIDTLTGSMAKLTKNMATAQKGTGDAAAAFSALGVSVTDNNGNLRNNQDVFNDAIKALGQMENETQRDAYAMQIFGKSAQDLNPLIEGGADKLKTLGDEAENAGLILSQDALNGLNSFNDSLDILKANASLSGNIIAGAFAGKLKTAVDLLNGALPDLAKSFAGLFDSKTLGDSAESLTDNLTKLGKAFSTKIAAELPDFLKGFNALITAIIKALVANLPIWINSILPTLITSFTDLILSIVDLLPSLLPMLVSGAITLFKGIIDGLNAVLDALLPMLPDIVQQISTSLVENLPVIIQSGWTLLSGLIQGIADNLPTLIQLFVDMMPTLLETVTTNLPIIIQAGIDILLAVIDGIVQMLPELIPIIIDMVILICDKLLENLPQIISAAIQIIVAVIQGLMEAIPQLIEYVPEIVASIVSALIENLPLLIEACYEIMSAIGSGLIESIGALLTFIPDIFDKLKEKFEDIDWAELGKNIIGGIVDGVEKYASNIGDSIKSAAGDALDGVKDLLGIHSPSRVFRDQVGKQMAAGIGIGFENEIKSVNTDISKAIPTNFETAVNATASGISSISNVTNNSRSGDVNYYISGVTINSDDDIQSLAYKLEFNRIQLQTAVGG